MTSGAQSPVDLAGMLHIDSAGDRAPFDQVRLGVIELIADGKLLVGARIPTVRALATELGLAANTVARSYRELETAGVIETRGRHGSFVKAGPDARIGAAQQAAFEFVKTVRELGIDDDSVVELVRGVLRPS